MIIWNRDLLITSSMFGFACSYAYTTGSDGFILVNVCPYVLPSVRLSRGGITLSLPVFGSSDLPGVHPY